LREAKERIEENTKLVEETESKLEDKKKQLEEKRKELEEIQKETEKEIKELEAKSKEISEQIEPRLLSAYKRIRLNVRNKLAVVRVQRDACGGCFNKVPPQRQVDIRSRKKIIVCEHCGRILIDKALAYEVYDELGGKFLDIKKKELEEEKELEKQKKPTRRTSRARAKK
jgi:predicted  nucleic acid-binding Zn-ribbon protein